MNKVKISTRVLDRILDNSKKNADDANKKVADEIVEIAKNNAPVVSGELKNSIETVSDNGKSYVVVGADHGGFVEFGTSKMAAQPYLAPAVREVRRRMAKHYKKVVTDGIK